MKVLIPPVYKRLEGEQYPFSVEPLGRRTFADNLTALFKNTDDGLVLSINAGWGAGKTSFVKLWELNLKNDKQFIPIYYDAFKNDFSNDPFLSIAVEIHKSLENTLAENGQLVDLKNEQQLNCLKKQTKKLAIELVKMSTGMAASQLTAGIVDCKKISDWTGEAVKKLLFGTLEEKMDAKFDAHLNSLSNITKYQEQLKDILKFGQDNNNQKKIIFFIDELDRCRPDFAVQVIESIKHLFNIDNVFFVLAIHKKQLASTIHATYGIEAQDADIYLQKFIDLETELPPIITRKIEHSDASKPDLEKLIQSLCALHGIEQYFTRNYLDYRVLVELVSYPGLLLNPRSIERAFSLIVVGIGSTIPDTLVDKIYLKSLCAMAFLKVARPIIYEKCRDGDIQGDLISEDISDDFFDLLKKYLDHPDNKHTPSAKRFTSQVVLQVCRILDIYSIPRPLENEVSDKSAETSLDK